MTVLPDLLRLEGPAIGGAFVVCQEGGAVVTAEKPQ